jgi:acyl-coenzyme A thioesterase PaaI-like protein
MGMPNGNPPSSPETLSAFAQLILKAQPFSVRLGAELVSFTPGHAELALAISNDLRQQHGFVHGGVVSYLADNALTFAGGSVLGDSVTVEEGRFDDAVARLYRALEAMAQVALKEVHGVESTEKVPLEQVPEFLRTRWAARANDGVVALGLQDDYALLSALGDSIGKQFQDAGLSETKSPLVARNRSILAHGFERVSEAVFDKLWTSALSLANVDLTRLPSFLVLAEGRP